MLMKLKITFARSLSKPVFFVFKIWRIWDAYREANPARVRIIEINPLKKESYPWIAFFFNLNPLRI